MLTIGVIGLGNGGGHHARVLAATPRVRLSALADSDENRLHEQARQLRVPRTYPDWRQLVADPAIDAVVIAAPPFLREEMFVAAAHHGKHILAEKPFGISLKQARNMATASERAGIKAMVNFGTRNLPVFQKLKSLLVSRKYGTPQWIWLKYYLVSDPRHFQLPAWFWQKRFSGGHLCENAGHAFDLACEILGPPQAVTGATAQLPLPYFGHSLRHAKPDIENIGVAILHHAHGKLTVVSSGTNPSGHWGMAFDIVTETSVISVRNDRCIEIMQGGKRVYQYTAPVGWNPIPYGDHAFVRHLTGRPHALDSIATPADGARAVAIADAAYRSAASGRTVSLKTSFPL